MQFLVVLACALAVASAGYVASPAVYGAHVAPVVSGYSHYAHPAVATTYAAAPAHYGYSPVAYSGYAAHLYRHRRGIYAPAPVAYSGAYSAYGHAYSPVTAYSAHAAPVVASTYAHAAYPGHSAFLYRHKRGIYAPAPVAYSGYSGAYAAPVVSTYSHAAPVVASTYAGNIYGRSAYSHPLAYY